MTHWEVWNEPNIRYFWLPEQDPKEYFQLLRLTYLTAKKADPECTILNGGIIGYDVEYLRGVYEQSGSRYFDVVSIHPYLGNDPFDLGTYSENMSAVKALISEFGDSHKEMWFTEMGWSTSENLSKLDQAAYLTRAYVLSLAMGADKMFWFNLNAAPPPEGSSGLIEHDLTPRPVFWAHKAYTEIVGEADYDQRIQMKQGVHAHLFRKSEEYVMVLWHPNETVDIGLNVKSKQSNPQVFDMLGERMDVSPKGRSLLLQASPHPIFISNLTEEDVKAITSKTTWILPISLILLLIVGGTLAYRRKPRGVIISRSEAEEKRPKKRRARKDDIPAECEKTFIKTVCLKCKHYVIQAGKGHCRKFGLDLE